MLNVINVQSNLSQPQRPSALHLETLRYQWQSPIYSLLVNSYADNYPDAPSKMSMPAYHLYLQKRLTWMPSMITQIHWIVLQRSLDKFNLNNQQCLVLFINEKLPLCASKAHPHHGSLVCPSCQREQETPRHILICEHLECKRLFTNLKANLMAAAQKLCLHPCILTAIWLGLTAVRNDLPYLDISHKLPIPFQSPIQCQSKLGWTQLYQGHISCS